MSPALCTPSGTKISVTSNQERMDSQHVKARMNVEGDRLSSLPDDLIHKILSFTCIEHAIETSALSSRWRYIWTSMPYLNFSSEDFHTLRDFSRFVTHVLSNRNNEVEVSSVKLTFRGNLSQMFVNRIFEYAFSHNVQHLNITCLLGNNIATSLSFISSHSLQNLTLTGCSNENYIMTPLTWDLPALATLNLYCVSLCDDKHCLISKCVNLKNLTLRNCRLLGLKGFNICHPGLTSLTLEDNFNDVNVDTPQLKNLTIKHCSGIHLIFAPNLSSLQYISYCYPLEISADLLNLKKVDICISHPYKDKAHAYKIVCLLQQLHRVQFLTLNSEIIKLLSSSVELIAHQSSPFANLKSLKIYPVVIVEELTQPKVTMSTEVRKYLLNSSPGATFTMVSHKNLMTELQDKMKKIAETNMTDIEKNKGINGEPYGRSGTHSSNVAKD